MTRRVTRVGRGSLAGNLVVADGWDSRDVNEVLAADFGLAP